MSPETISADDTDVVRKDHIDPSARGELTEEERLAKAEEKKAVFRVFLEQKTTACESERKKDPIRYAWAVLAEYYNSGELLNSEFMNKLEEKVTKAKETNSSALSVTKKALERKGVRKTDSSDESSDDDSHVVPSAMPTKAVREVASDDSGIDRMTDITAVQARFQEITSPFNKKSTLPLETYQNTLVQLTTLYKQNSSLPAHYAKAFEKEMSELSAKVNEMERQQKKQQALKSLDKNKWAAHVRGTVARMKAVRMHNEKLELLKPKKHLKK